MVGEVLLARVAADERVKMSYLAAALGPQDTPQPLRFLLPRAECAGHLDQHVGIGQIEGEVADLRQNQRANLAAAEPVVQILALAVVRLAGDERDVETLAQLAELLQVLPNDKHAAVG